MACPSGELPLGQREGSGRILVRIEGACTREHKAGNNAEITQRAKVGRCPCCTRPTHIAVPLRYVVGESREISLWGISSPRPRL